MKARAKLSYSVRLNLEGKDEESIMDWLTEHTPGEAQEDVLKATGKIIDEDYDEEIMFDEEDICLRIKSPNWKISLYELIKILKIR